MTNLVLGSELKYPAISGNLRQYPVRDIDRLSSAYRIRTGGLVVENDPS